MRTRLRPAHSPEVLAELYATPHDHTQWPDHQLRVTSTISVANWLIRESPSPSVADLSCGDAAIIDAVRAGYRIRGDIAPGYPICGPIEETLPEISIVDLLILSETIEHLDNPDLVLSVARSKAHYLVLSTPIGEGVQERNIEHYWGWGVEDMLLMLTTAGFTPVTMMELHLVDYTYDFQIWGCH